VKVKSPLISSTGNGGRGVVMGPDEPEAVVEVLLGPELVVVGGLWGVVVGGRTFVVLRGGSAVPNGGGPDDGTNDDT